MEIKLTHPFVNMCDIESLLGNPIDPCILINTFCNSLESQAENFKDRFKPDKYKGDGLECLVEFLIKCRGNDNNIGITDYNIVEASDDTGVDGKGISIFNQHPATVQVKYRQANHILSANEDHLSNFVVASWGKYGVKVQDDKNMLIITTAGDIHHFTKNEMLCDKVRIINREGLREMLDGNKEFWNDFRKSLISSKTQSIELKPIKLRQHQIEAVSVVENHIHAHTASGIIELPTGTGKSLVEADLIKKFAKEFKCFAIFSPRILLSFQLLKTICNYLKNSGIDAEYLNVNSGKFPEDEINEARALAGFETSAVLSTTSPDAIKETYDRAIKNNKILIISSTYHSAEQIVNSGIEIDIQINDEAHHLVSDVFSQFSNIGKYSYSFTATPKITGSDHGFGMDNTKFGGIIFKKIPKEMIDAGEMLPPALHIVSSDGSTSNRGEVFNGICAAFDKHVLELKRISRLPNHIGAKLLVAVNGQEALKGIIESKEFYTFRITRPEVKIIAMSTDVGVYLDGVLHDCTNKWKQEALASFQAMDGNQQAIVFYVDMLGEGIDVPGITAYMPLRGLSDTSFRQGLGRACRLQEDDRRELYQGTLLPNQKAKFIKPYAWIVLPQFSRGSDDYIERFKDLLYVLVDDYGMPLDMVKLDTLNGIDDKSELDPLSGINRRTPQLSKSGLDKFYHEIKEDLDRPITINELAFINLINECCCSDANTAIREKIYEKLSLKDPLKVYEERAYRRREAGDDYMDMINKNKKHQRGVFSDECRKKFGTIYTPEFVVEKTVGLALKYLPKDKKLLDLEFIDPAAGDGNFLIYLYNLLMKVDDSRFTDPVKKSVHILTHCLWGIEILQPMYLACKLRLLTAHILTCQKHGKLVDINLFDNLKIYWGNTILTPEDKPEEWTVKPSEGEGGLLAEEIRNKKWDCVIGNPPYTHLRNLDNRRYAAYPKQRDMAQVFVRWSLDHLKEDGVTSLNTIDTWLDVKLSDGAKETRKLLYKRIKEIENDENVRRYSENKDGVGGGEIPTMIICIGEPVNSNFVLNGQNNIYDLEQLCASRFLLPFKTNKTIFVSVSSIKYGTLQGFRSDNKHGSKTTEIKSFIFKQYDPGDLYLISKRGVFEGTYTGNWRLIETNNAKMIFENEFESETKAMIVKKDIGLWLVGYLNTNDAKNRVKDWCRLGASHGGWFAIVASGTFKQCQVPDFDYYKTNRPEQFAAYMKWIEDNMKDKDKFLAGIDEEFDNIYKS